MDRNVIGAAILAALASKGVKGWSKAGRLKDYTQTLNQGLPQGAQINYDPGTFYFGDATLQAKALQDLAQRRLDVHKGNILAQNMVARQEADNAPVVLNENNDSFPSLPPAPGMASPGNGGFSLGATAQLPPQRQVYKLPEGLPYDVVKDFYGLENTYLDNRRADSHLDARNRGLDIRKEMAGVAQEKLTLAKMKEERAKAKAVYDLKKAEQELKITQARATYADRYYKGRADAANRPPQRNMDTNAYMLQALKNQYGDEQGAEMFIQWKMKGGSSGKAPRPVSATEHEKLKELEESALRDLESSDYQTRQKARKELDYIERRRGGGSSGASSTSSSGGSTTVHGFSF